MQDIPRSFIKNVALQISGAYKFDNAPFSDNEKDKKSIPFIGRKLSRAKFLEFLNGNSKKGVFLVTGFKGMGKTSFVNYVVKQYRKFDLEQNERNKKQKSKIIPIHLTLAQNKPKEIDILRLLVSSVHDKYKAYRYGTRVAKLINTPIKTWFYLLKLLLFPLLFLTAAVELQKFKGCIACIGSEKLYSWEAINEFIAWVEPFIAPGLFLYIVIFVFFKYRVFRFERKDSPNNRIIRLMEKCYASLSEEYYTNEEFSIANIKSKFNDNEKRTKQYPVAETKQIEYELQEFLRKVSEEESLEFIFIFDELDKVDPIITTSYLYEDMETFENKKAEASYERDMRERKQAIINIIAGLKNFFTTANARFIFIAGREMFDASLADIADRQSSISSIFTYIFNIESLLKETDITDSEGDDIPNRTSLSNAIEVYLKKLLFTGTLKLSLYQASKEEYKAFKQEYGDNFINRFFFIVRSFSVYLKFRRKSFFTYPSRIFEYFFLRNKNSPRQLITDIQSFLDISKKLKEAVKSCIDEGKEQKIEIYIDKYFVEYNEEFRKKLVEKIKYKENLQSSINGAIFKYEYLNKIVEDPEIIVKDLKKTFILASIDAFLNDGNSSLCRANKTINSKYWKRFQVFLVYIMYRANFSIIRLIKAIPEYYFHKGKKPIDLINELTGALNRKNYRSKREIRKAIHLFFEPKGKSLYLMAQELYLPQTLNQTKLPKELELKLGKLYFTLQNFVTFLTYRSNGSPQKLIKTIHDFIIVKNDFNEEKGKNLIYKQNQKGPYLYLHFNYEKQYQIGFINYLYRPFLIRLGGTLKLSSDNIIVSTTYLFDHLLKFHPFAFSLSNLEMIPEVISTNKTPSLRQHIRLIIDHLSTSHIRETELSLFDYKFYSRTLNEIKYLSKIFEQEAAAFNFTLDESYLVKLHISNKIKGLRSIYYKFKGHSETDRQIFSISHLNEILGDLHFFDQEYDDAITAYSDGVKAINQLDINAMDLRDFVTLIKNKLKLGLCFEKTKSYEEALALYSDCCNDAKEFMVGRLINGRPFVIQELKNYNVIKANDDKDFKDIVFYSSALSNQLQIILQGFLAKIFMQEKLDIEGISDLKLGIAIGGFLKMTEGFLDPHKRNYLLKANAYMFIGKLLFFKNNQAEFKLEDDLNEQKRILPQNFLNQIRKLIKSNEFLLKEQSKKNKSRTVFALSMYMLSLYEVLSAKKDSSESAFVKKISGFESNHVQVITPNFVKLLIKDIERRINQTNGGFRGVHYRYLGTLLSNIGDCLLSIYKTNSRKYNAFTINELFDKQAEWASEEALKKQTFNYFLKESENQPLDLTDVLKCYYLSGQYLFKYGRKISCSFQYNKILHVLRTVLKNKANEIQTKANDKRASNFLKMLEIKIVNPLLKIASETSGNIDTHTIKKAKTLQVKKPFALNNTSYHPESREVVMLYNYIAIKLGKKPNIEILISSYNTIGTQHARMMELDFYAKYLYETKIAIFVEKLKKPDISFDEKDDDVIINYLFTRFTMVRILEIYEPDYSLGFRYLAYTHYRIAHVLTKCSDIIQRDNKYIKQRLNDLLGRNSFTSFAAIYHYQRAKELYEKTVQLHTGGNEYKKMMNDMIYLEDDFNDNAYHFGAALDRYFIVNDALTNKLHECNEAINGSDNYLADSYL